MSFEFIEVVIEAEESDDKLLDLDPRASLASLINCKTCRMRGTYSCRFLNAVCKRVATYSCRNSLLDVPKGA